MAVSVVKLLLILFPLSFILFTYYLLFCLKRETKKYNPSNDASFEGLADVLEYFTVKCPANFYNSNSTCVPCPIGEFSLSGWISCMSLLSCENISQDVRIRRRLSDPGPLNAVKDVYLAEWHGYKVVYMRCSHEMYSDDCLHGLRMVEALQGSQYVVQLIGICHDTLEMVTAYYQYGSPDKLDKLFENSALARYNTVKIRFQLCLDYVKSLHFLHNSPIGTRVMCDSNDLLKTLSQYLITDDFHLVLNDLDALPEVNRKKHGLIKCGHRQLFGNFVAPEQLWPFKDGEFSDNQMPAYDEKVDIWRIPNVCDKMLSRVANSNYIRRLLLEIHDRCKYIDPRKRPSAKNVLKVYLRVDDIVKAGLKEEM